LLLASQLIELISGAVTALATGVTAWLLWQSSRREAARENPIIECELRPLETGLLWARFSVRNRLDETVVITAARIRSPVGSKIGCETQAAGVGKETPVIPSEPLVEIQRQIAPIGSLHPPIFTLPGSGPSRSDISTVDFYVLLPDSWSGGKLRIDLRISNRSLAVRDKWFTVRRTISFDVVTKLGANRKRQLEN
jgi:hypothetical protein